ncbi:hypothetical protein [Bacillus sp. FJAT-45037]|uniref:hypothetical protein n=1 Tax=Bacillus sp. FJAT-45037 TaxID=2011007 RepID=UPI000C23917A|nr:hypothetical protein [Bacillus sp. FJAT-45037]
MKVFYEEIDGSQQPKLLIVPASKSDQTATYEVCGPFERFYTEEFHDEFRGLTVTLGELLRVRDKPMTFSISLLAVKTFLLQRYGSSDVLDEIDYFVLLIDDIEELLQVEVRVHITKQEKH